MPTPAIIAPQAGSVTTAISTSLRVGTGTGNGRTYDQTITVAAGGLTTTLVTVGGSDVNPGATSIAVVALPAAIPIGAVFYIKGTRIQLTAAASSAATTISCVALKTGLKAADTGNYYSLAVSALPDTVRANTVLTFSNGSKVQTIADAAAAATALNLQWVSGTPVSTNTAVFNQYPTAPNLSQLDLSGLANTQTSTGQFFGQALGFQAKAGVTPGTFTLQIAGTDTDATVADLIAAGESPNAPTSTRGFLINAPDGAVYVIYADVSYVNPQTGSPTDTFTHQFQCYVREIVQRTPSNSQ